MGEIGLVVACVAAIAVDGDTLRCADNSRIRLAAIDAPELSQTCRVDGHVTVCGRDARGALGRMIIAGQMVCTLEGRDRWDRAIATCRVDGRDIGQAMVEGGHAIAFTRYGGARYARAQASAQSARKGMHAGRWIDPSEWRRGVRWEN